MTEDYTYYVLRGKKESSYISCPVISFENLPELKEFLFKLIENIFDSVPESFKKTLEYFSKGGSLVPMVTMSTTEDLTIVKSRKLDTERGFISEFGNSQKLIKSTEPPLLATISTTFSEKFENSTIYVSNPYVYILDSEFQYRYSDGETEFISQIREQISATAIEKISYLTYDQCVETFCRKP